ncbi:MAG: permease prefix domain 1-containing protein [Turicibacter sp.]|nr:permease prefix domain 1-containing protein [Turicibacter sp.]
MKILENYVDAMFRDFPETEEMLELKQTILESMEAKYDDLLADGKNEQEALGTVIAQFGDIEELKEAYSIEPEEREHSRKTVNINASGVKIRIDKDSDSKKLHISNDDDLDIEDIIEPEVKKKHKNRLSDIWVPISVAVFLLSGFVWGIWNPSWALIPMTALVTDSLYRFRRRKSLSSIVVPLAVAIYLYLGAWHGLWHPAWVIIPVTAIITSVFKK